MGGIKYYKAFKQDMTCRGFQYEVGKTYKHNREIGLCYSGFHACENPFDCWSYYDIMGSRFALVSVGDEIENGGDDSKIVSAEITIRVELNLPDFIRAGVRYLITLAKSDIDSGDYAQQASSGDYAKQASIGKYAKQASSGPYAKQASSGYGTQQASSGPHAQQASSGYGTQQASSGPHAKQASSGDYAKQASIGKYAKQASSGDNTQHNCEGKNSVIASSGDNTVAKGVKGTWIALAEYKGRKCVGFATGCIGKNNLKPDVFYRAKGGKLVEVER